MVLLADMRWTVAVPMQQADMPARIKPSSTHTRKTTSSASGSKKLAESPAQKKNTSLPVSLPTLLFGSSHRRQTQLEMTPAMARKKVQPEIDAHIMPLGMATPGLRVSPVRLVPRLMPEKAAKTMLNMARKSRRVSCVCGLLAPAW